MALWIELRCDARLRGCVSDSGSETQPMVLVANGFLFTGTKTVEAEGLRHGWTVKKGRWSCPNCSRKG